MGCWLVTLHSKPLPALFLCEYAKLAKKNDEDDFTFSPLYYSRQPILTKSNGNNLLIVLMILTAHRS